MRKSIDAAAASETSIVKLDGTLRSMGRTADISAAQVENIATQLQKASTFDDEQIVDAYTALSRFEAIPTGNLKEIVKVAMDMSVVLGGDLASNAADVAKILESGLIPRTWGWSVALKDQVKKMVDSGDTAGALNIVMEKLNSQFGGQATAQLNTYAGSVKNLGNEWETLMENIGGPFLGAGKGISGFATGVVSSFNDMFDMFRMTPEQYQKAHWAFKNLEQDIPPITDNTKLYTRAMYDMNYAIGMTADQVQAFISGGSWQEMWTSATTGADKTKMEFDMLGQGLQDLGAQGAGVWENYLFATGHISEAALREFTTIEAKIAQVKAMLAAGWSITMVVNWLQSGSTTPLNAAQMAQAGGVQNVGQWGSGGDTSGTGTGGRHTVLANDGVLWYVDDAGWSTVGYKAKGGQLGKGWSAVGEQGEEGVSPSGMVIPHSQWENMKRRGLVPGMHRAGGGSMAHPLEDPGDYRYPEKLRPSWVGGWMGRGATAPPSDLYGPQGSSGGASSAVQQASISLSSSAASISASGDKTASATQQNTQITATGQSAMLDELRSINTRLTMMPKDMAAAVAKVIPA